jgi:hypothetical protein
VSSSATTKRITRAVTSDDLRDLLGRPVRAAIAYNDGGAVQTFPVSFRYRDGRFLFARPPDAAINEGNEAILLVDEGCYHAELRGISVRGQVRGSPDEGASPAWLEIAPQSVTAWDYGAMRER